MSHSSTGTTTFLLSKYSRSYPVKRTLQKAQIASQLGPDLMPDWQHFTNPIIRLVLDIKTTSDSEIQSVKLRIFWELNSDIEAGSGNPQDVLFEDLELLSFSSLVTSIQRKNQPEGLPLKAVYRDAVVGIRYLHSREEGIPVYRRFQISFQVPSQASEFIEIIKPVCPCKLNPTALPPPVPSGVSTLANRTTMQRTVTSIIPSTSALANRVTPVAYPPPALPVHTQVKNRYISQPIPSQAIPYSSSPLALNTSDRVASNALDIRGSDECYQVKRKFVQGQNAAPVASSEPLQKEISAPGTQPCNFTGTPNAYNLPSSSLSSLLTPSSSNSGINGSFSAPANPYERAIGAKFVQNIMDGYNSIYNLPNTALERRIGEIIHEDGFVQLVERMSDMLTARTLVRT